MEFRSYNSEPLEIRQSGNELKIGGFAAVYNSDSQDFGGFKERILPGAFDQTLQEVKDGKRDVVARFNHEGGFNTLARTSNGSLALSADARGLRYVATLPNTSAAKDVYEMIRSGLVNKSSFAFSLPEDGSGQRWDFSSNPAIRQIVRVNLHDVAPVDEPAYEATSVSVRTFEEAEFDYYQNIISCMQERLSKYRTN